MEPASAAMSRSGEVGADRPVPTAEPGAGAGGALAATDGGGRKMPIEQLIRSFAIVAAAFYVVGFLTANSYLYLLGVSDFSLLRTRFILTGVMVIAPLAFALTFGIYAAIDLSVFEWRRGRVNRTWLWIAGDVLLPFLLYFVLFSVVAENETISALVDAAVLSVICSTLVLAFLATLAVHRRTDRHPVSHLFYRGDRVIAERFNERFGIPGALVENLVFVVIGTLLFLLYVGLFGQRFYPMLPEQLGGGRPRTAQLLIAADAATTVNRLGIAVTAEDLLSPPVELLWEGETSYVIRLPTPRQRAVVQISHDLVEGVVTGQALTPLGTPVPS
jgi:hypothetical protein